MARLKSDKRRGRLTFLLFDESETNLVGHPRLIPQHIALPTRCPIEIAHEGFLVGEVCAYFLNDPNGLSLPALEGNYVLASAYLYDSDLSGKVMEAVKHGILTHACPNIWSPPGSPTGTGLLVQISLVPNDLPGCPNARILEWSE